MMMNLFCFLVRLYSSGYSSQVPTFGFGQWWSVLFVVLIADHLKCKSNCCLCFHIKKSLVSESALGFFFFVCFCEEFILTFKEEKRAFTTACCDNCYS